MGQESVCYRLRVLQVDNLPPPQLSSGASYGLQLGVSFFDETLGQFYGNTCYSLDENLQHDQPAVDFSFDAMFHSSISDPNCMAVVRHTVARCTSPGLSLPCCCNEACLHSVALLNTTAWLFMEHMTDVLRIALDNGHAEAWFQASKLHLATGLHIIIQRS